MSGLSGGWAALAEQAPDEIRQLAYFVTAHGFGHATRAGAVMAALRARDPGLHFHVFTQAPEWVFAETVGQGFTYHSAVTDVGLVQASALVEDVDATLERLDAFLPFEKHLVHQWGEWVRRLGCELVLCDIAPLGLAVAQAAGLPSVLIENFTWDWIYAGYLDRAPGLARHLETLRQAFTLADHHLQTDPLCGASARASALLPPIARRPRLDRLATRSALGLERHERMVLVTLGGVKGTLTFPVGSTSLADVVYVFPGGASERQRKGQRLLLPFQSAVFHPDLIAASDAVIGKTGYSTVAETYHAGVPFGYVSRASFRESPVMARFIQVEMEGREIPAEAFEAGDWESYVTDLLERPHRPAARPNGADAAAAYIARLI